MAKEKPWHKWYPQDWLSEPGLSMCDAASRGIWADAVNVMLLEGTYKVSGSEEQLSRLLRCRILQLQAAICDFKQNDLGKVSMQNGCIIIECRRLRKEWDISQLRATSASSRWCKTDANTHAKQHAKPMQTPMQTSASASASASASKEGGVGEGRNGVERPSLNEVLARADMTGLAPWKARDWFQEMEGCGWLDYNHRPVIQWQPMLDRVRTKWEADGRPMSPPAAKNAPKRRVEPTL